MSKRNLPLVLYTADPTAAPVAGEAFEEIKADTNGLLWTRPFASDEPITARSPNSSAVPPSAIHGLDVVAWNYGYNGVTFDRIRVNDDDSDAVATNPRGVLENNAKIQGFNGTTYDRVRSAGDNADAVAVKTLGVLETNSKLQGFNGTTFDRLRTADDNSDALTPIETGVLNVLNKNYLYYRDQDEYERQDSNDESILLASAARTATVDTADQTNRNHKGMQVIADVTAVTGTPIVTLLVQAKDPVSGSYGTILSLASTLRVIETSINTLYPGVTAGNQVLPRTWRIQCSHANADSITYSLAVQLIV